MSERNRSADAATIVAYPFAAAQGWYWASHDVPLWGTVLLGVLGGLLANWFANYFARKATAPTP